jgi:HEAT repeat protein
MITVLAERNDESIRDTAMVFIQHENQDFREAAIKAFPGIAGAEDIPFLVSLASESKGKERDVVRTAFYSMSGKDIDSYILKQVSNVEDHLAKEYIKAIGERNILHTEEVLIQTAESSNPEVRLEAYRALAKIGSPEHLDRILEILLKTENKRERQQLERTISQLASRSGENNVPSKVVIENMNKTTDNKNISSLISVLGDIKNPEDVEVLIKYLDSDNTDVRLSAIRALSDWPNADPLETMKTIIRETEDARVKALSLKGCTQIILNENDFSEEQRVEELQFCMSQAGAGSEKKLVISALGKVQSIKSLSFLIDELAGPGGNQPELEAAILNIAPGLIENDRENTLPELKRAAEYSDKDEILKLLEDVQ